MSTSSALRYPSVFELFYFVFILSNVLAIPVPSKITLYDISVQSLLDNKCKMPKEIHLPFSETSDPSTFDYLKVPLKECQMAEAMVENNESNLLCKEIFEVLKNITCSNYTTSLPKIKSTRLPNDVCSEFKSMEDILSKENNYLSGRLVDDIICKVLCRDKFETLCQTLLWSYDVQNQIKNILRTEVAEEKKDTKTIPNKDLGTQKISQEPILDSTPNKGEPLIAEGQEVAENINEQTKIVNELNSNNLESEASSSANPLVNPTPSNQLETVGVNKDPADNNKLSEDVNPALNTNLPAAKSVDLDMQGTTDQQNDLQGNGQYEPHKNDGSTNVENNNVITKKKEMVLKDLPEVKNADKISKNSTAGISTEDIHGKEASSSTLQDQDRNNPNMFNSNNVEPISKLEEISTVSNISEENELKNDFQGEENESKVQGNSDSKIPVADNINKLTDTSKETAVQSKIAPDIELSTLQISPDINANIDQDEEQDDKDAEQYYNDTENNEGDYPKSEYEHTLNEMSKAKKPEIKSSVVSEVANPNEFPGNYDPFLNRNNIGRGRGDMQIIPTFPEQEDSHFFFYFLSIVLILMAGYLIFHNKQKIIALIVEGRHERRRRSHGAGYKKLETK